MNGPHEGSELCVALDVKRSCHILEAKAQGYGYVHGRTGILVQSFSISRTCRFTSITLLKERLWIFPSGQGRFSIPKSCRTFLQHVILNQQLFVPSPLHQNSAIAFHLQVTRLLG